MNIFAKTVIAAAALSVAPVAQAATLVVDVTGATAVGVEGTAGNTVLTYNIGANAQVTGISYDVSLTAFDPSWLSELEAIFGGSLLSELVLTPGFEDDVPGTGTFSGVADLVDLGLDFTVGADGILRIEFADGFNDASVSPDGIWNSGTITVTHTGLSGAVPEPATWALMILGMGAVGGAMRYRRRETRVRFA